MQETPNDRLKIFRTEELDISQKEMAKSLEIQQGSYSDIERGRVGVNGIITKLIRTYRINPIWLVEGIGKRSMDDINLLFSEKMINKRDESLQIEEDKQVIFELLDRLALSPDESVKNEIKNLIGKMLLDKNRYLVEISELKTMIIDLLKKRQDLKDLIKKF